MRSAGAIAATVLFWGALPAPCSASPAGGDAAKAPRLAVILDRSDGMQDQAGRACENLRRVVEKLIGSHRNRATSLSVFLTGTKDRVGPSLLDQFTFEGFYAAGGIEASKSGHEQAIRLRAEAVGRLVAKCQKEAKPSSYSPLFAALRDVVKDLRQRCGPNDGCQVIFYTDLQEVAEPWLCTEIFGAEWYGKADGCPRNPGRKEPKKTKGPDGKPRLAWDDAARPKPVDAAGIRVSACGVSESADAPAAKMSSDATERRDQLWKELFPGAATFEILGSCAAL